MTGAPSDREPTRRERAPGKPPPALALEDGTADEQDRERLEDGTADEQDRERLEDGTADEQDRERLDPGTSEEIPPRLVVVAYALALVCAVAPLAVLGAGFAGAVLFRHGRRGAGLGVIAVSTLCAGLGIVLLR